MHGQDCCTWNLGDGLLRRLKARNVRALLHFWGGCHNSEQYQRAHTGLGSALLGFYLDDGSSDAEARGAVEFMQSVAPGDSACVMKAYQNREPSTTPVGLASSNVCYVGDLSYAFQGIGMGIERVLSLQYDVAAPYNELTGYGFLEDGTPDEETYIRRLHFGCFQPVMAHTPYANADPWLPQYSPQLIDVYRYYAWLHKELVPYFYSYAYGMFEDPGDPAVRVLRSGPSSSSFGIGNELFVAVVTSSTDTLGVTLPPESPWIDYWDESVVLSGSRRKPSGSSGPRAHLHQVPRHHSHGRGAGLHGPRDQRIARSADCPRLPARRDIVPLPRREEQLLDHDLGRGGRGHAHARHESRHALRLLSSIASAAGARRRRQSAGLAAP